MMKQINNVFSWILLDQELLYSDKINKQFCVDVLNNKTPEKYDLNYPPTYLYQVPGNGFVIVDSANRPSSIYAENKLLPFDRSGTNDIVIKEQDPRYIVVYQTEGISSRYKVFDWAEKKVIIEATRPFTIVKDKALSIIDEVLYCYNLKGELNWQYSPASGSIEIKKIIGLYEHELWIKLTDDRFLVLDAVTGKALSAPMDLKEIFGLSELSIGDIHLDEKSGRIRILAFAYYIEIDLATHKPAIKLAFEGDWAIGRGRFYDGDVRVYFTSDYPNLGKTIGHITAGIFNTETLEVEWHYSLSGEDRYHFFVGQPQANEKYFAVKDSNDMLYLFER